MKFISKILPITISIVCLSLILPINAQNTEPPATQNFTDVNEGNLSFVAITQLKNNAVIKGYDDGTFRPDNKVNRAEALEMIIKAIPQSTEKSVLETALSQVPNLEESKFKDVPTDSWFFQSVSLASKKNIVSGYKDGTFHPEQNITIAEALTILLRAAQTELPPTEPTIFNDVSPKDWYAQQFQYAKNTLIVEIYKGTEVHPNAEITRGELANLIYKFTKNELGSNFGSASFYSDSLEGRGTASGEKYSKSALTAAHKTLPFGTKIEVKNLSNGKTVIVHINDRGPYGNIVRKLDLSKAAFESIGNTSSGYIFVEYKVIPQ